ncbi:MAG: proton-conducting transporter transmembrane domain-containing protein [Anaerolineales bacterium]
MPAPLLFILLPMVSAPLVYVARLRGWHVVEVGLAVVTALALLTMSIWLPIEGNPFVRDSFDILGRTFILEAADRSVLGIICAQAALIFFGVGLNTHGRYFLSAGLLALALLAAALFVRPFLYAAIFFVAAAALEVFMLADGGPQATRGALRYLTFTTLALPFILFTGWLLDATVLSPDYARATFLLLAGMAILLGVIPFHSWLPVAAEHSPPLATAFVGTVMRSPVLFLLLRFLNAYDWLGDSPAVLQALTLAGVGMTAVGAVFVFGQRNLGRALGYALMIDIGATLLGIGLGTRAGIEVVLATLALRGLGLWLWAVAAEQLRRVTASGELDFESLRGVGWRYPFAVTAMPIGVLSLMGLPLMAGFAPRWALLRLMAEDSLVLAVLVLAAMTAVGVVVMRSLAAMTTPRSPDEVIAPQETLVQRVVYVAGVVLVLVLGVFPQWVLPLITGAAAAFERFGP